MAANDDERPSMTVNMHLHGVPPIETGVCDDPARGWVSIGPRIRAEITLFGSFDDLRSTLAAALRAVITTEAKARAAHYNDQAKQAEMAAS